MNLVKKKLFDVISSLLLVNSMLTQVTCLLIGLLCLAAQAKGITYHVASTGDDFASGTEANPWRTLGKANKMAAPGDVILIGPGNWDEYITILAPGTRDYPIQWRGSGKNITICDRFTIKVPFIEISDMSVKRFVETNAENVIIERIKFTWPGGRQFWVHPTNRYTGPSGVVARHCDFIDCGYAAAVSLNGSHGLVENCFFTTANGGDAIYLNGRNNTIRGCVFENWNRPAGSTQHTDLFQSFSNNGEISEDHIIENNFAIDCRGTQIGNVTDLKLLGKIRGWKWRNNIFVRVSNPLNLFCPDFEFTNNTFYDSPSGAGSSILIYASADRGVAHNTKIFNNLFYKCGSNPDRPSQGAYGFSLGGRELLGFEADYNLVIGEGKGTIKGAWWNQFSSNQNGFNGVDPLFRNAVNPTKREDLQILPGSPALGSGRNFASLFTKDCGDRDRGERWDLGAWQYHQDSPPKSKVQLQAPTNLQVKP